jgi:hypothetical protein
MRGLLADLPRKNCWTGAEHAGAARAYGMQRLLYQAVWDEDAARDAVRRFAVRHLAAPGAMLIPAHSSSIFTYSAVTRVFSSVVTNGS